MPRHRDLDWHVFISIYSFSSVTKPASATWVGHQGFPPSEKDLVTKFLVTLCLESLADKTWTSSREETIAS